MHSNIGHVRDFSPTRLSIDQDFSRTMVSADQDFSRTTLAVDQDFSRTRPTPGKDFSRPRAFFCACLVDDEVVVHIEARVQVFAALRCTGFLQLPRMGCDSVPSPRCLGFLHGPREGSRL